MLEFEIELKLKEMKHIIEDMLDFEYRNSETKPVAKIFYVYLLDSKNQIFGMWQAAIMGKSSKSFNAKLQKELMELVGERVEIVNTIRSVTSG